ncbi:MAG: alpha/beta fold hydrolase, partial [Polyangiaceae bacterium]
MLPIDEWRARGQMIETRDGRVWAMDTGPAPGIPIVLLHGFPTSSWDFAPVIEKLAGRRVITLDFLGF